MPFCTTKRISTRQCYNNEYKVISIHKNISLALKKGDREGYGVVEIGSEIKRGDSVNDNGKLWESD